MRATVIGLFWLLLFHNVYSQSDTELALTAYLQTGKKSLRIYVEKRAGADSIIIPNEIHSEIHVQKKKKQIEVIENGFDFNTKKISNRLISIYDRSNRPLTVLFTVDDGGSTVEAYQYNSKGLLTEHITTTCYSALDCETERICYSYDAQNRTEKSTKMNGKDTVELTTHYYDSITGLLQLSRTINFIKPKPVDPAIGIGFNTSYPFRVLYHYENRLLKSYEVNYSDSSSYEEVNTYDVSGRLTAKSETYYFRKKFVEFTTNSTYNATGKIVRREFIRPYSNILLDETLFFYDGEGLLFRSERHFFNPDQVTTTTYIYE